MDDTVSGKVAFCVVTWNNAAIIGLCLDSLRAQTDVQADIYLLDNASTDDTRSVVESYQNIHATWSNTNQGFARGNNLLIQQALQDPDVRYVALINSDAVLSPDWTSALVRFAEQRNNVGSLQGLTLDYYNHSTIDSQHIFVSWNMQAVQYGYGEKIRTEAYYPRKVFGVNAAAAIYTRAMIETLPDRQNAFFDERFFMYYEDVDVAFRALVTGWDAWFVPDATAYHMGSVSAKRLGSIYSTRMSLRNLPAMVFKNAPMSVIWRSLKPAAYQILAITRDIACNYGKRAGLQTGFAAIYGVLRLPIYMSSRRRIQAVQVIPSGYLLRILHNDGILG